MAENHDEYITAAHERVTKSRANNPETQRKSQAARAAKALDEKSYHRKLCDLSFTMKHSFDDHLKSAKHCRKSTESTNPFRCTPCNLGFLNISNLRRHNKSERHLRNVETLESSVSLD